MTAYAIPGHVNRPCLHRSVGGFISVRPVRADSASRSQTPLGFNGLTELPPFPVRRWMRHTALKGCVAVTPTPNTFVSGTEVTVVDVSPRKRCAGSARPR